MLVELVKIGIFKMCLKFVANNMNKVVKKTAILNYINILTNDVKRYMLKLCNFTTDKKR